MAIVRVGTKHIVRTTGFETEQIDDDGVEIQQHWVEIDGTMLPLAYESDLLGVDYVFDNDKRHGYVTIRLMVSAPGGFATVDHREPHGEDA